jgi:hypothetical protein
MTFCTSSYAIEISGLTPYGISNIELEQLELLEEKIGIQIVPKKNTRSCYKMTQNYIVKNRGNVGLNMKIGVYVTDAYDLSPVPEDTRFFVDGFEYKHTIVLHESVYRELFDGEGETLVRTINFILIDIVLPPDTEKVIRLQYTNDWDNLQGNSAIMCKKGPYYDLAQYCVDWNSTPKFSVAIENRVMGEYNFEYQWIGNMRFFKKTVGGIVEQAFLLAMLKDMDIPENELFKIKKTSENTWSIYFTTQFVEQYERAFYVTIYRWGESELGAYCLMYGNELNLQPLGWDGAAKISERKLGPYELIFLTNKQLRIMRNTFYARHGYVFKSEELLMLFSKDVGYGFNYQENPNFSESMLTEIDRANIATIQRLEAMEYEP